MDSTRENSEVGVVVVPGCLYKGGNFSCFCRCRRLGSQEIVPHSVGGPSWGSCSCSSAYGHGPAVGPQTGKRCWPLLAALWRAVGPLMCPWCAGGEVPNAANLNLYRGWKACDGWHSDDEPLFGGCGEPKLIVSISFGTQALFKWRGKP